MTRPVLTRKRKQILLDLIIIALAFVALIAGRNADGQPADEHATVPSLEVAGEYRAIAPEPRPAAPQLKAYTLTSGDTAYGLLLENSLSPAAAKQLIAATRPTFNLARVLPDHELRLSFTPDGQRLTRLEYDITTNQKLMVNCGQDGYSAEIISHDPVLAASYSGSLKQVDLTINAGDRVCDLLKGQGLCDYQIDRLLKGARKVFSLSDIKPGHNLSLWITPAKPVQLGKLRYEIDDLNVLELEPQDGEFKAVTIKREYQVRLASATGEVETSLYESGLKAGLPAETIMGLTDIFAWDVNFFTEIQPGDRYTVLYEKYYVEGEFKRYGKILAATFDTCGEHHSAVHFASGDGSAGYYNEDGRPLKKLFLKAPLNYSRISSRFSYHRIHPVFKTARPHLGVDYAAPRGTPVVALGRGHVFFKGRAGGFGNCVKIKHPAGYVTYYGHLSRFAKGLKTGQSVDQGEVIGYVGSTGISTGPHLDFRVKHDGQFVNPLRLDSVTADRLAGRELAEFRKLTARRFNLIDAPSLNIAKSSDNNKPQI